MIAVLTAVIMVFALIPVVALALASYTRSAVDAEMVRSSDSGALAGAAALALVNVTAVPLPPTPLVVPSNATVVGPGGTACRAALEAFAANAALSSSYATPPSCNAVFSPPPAFGSCVSQLLGALPVPPITVPTLPGLPLPLPVVSPTSIASILISLLPALTDNGVTVTLTYDVQGPLDAVFPGQQATTETAVSTARRRFKRLLPFVPGSVTVGDLTVDQAALVVAIRGAIQVVRDLVNGAVGPIAGPVLPASCVVAANDALDDLSDALKVLPSGTGQIGCLLGLVVSAPDPRLVLPPALACTGDVFRAQLAP